MRLMVDSLSPRSWRSRSDFQRRGHPARGRYAREYVTAWKIYAPRSESSDKCDKGNATSNSPANPSSLPHSAYRFPPLTPMGYALSTHAFLRLHSLDTQLHFLSLERPCDAFASLSLSLPLSLSLSLERRIPASAIDRNWER